MGPVGPFTQNWFTSKCEEYKKRSAYTICFCCDISCGCDPITDEIQ